MVIAAPRAASRSTTTSVAGPKCSRYCGLEQVARERLGGVHGEERARLVAEDDPLGGERDQRSVLEHRRKRRPARADDAEHLTLAGDHRLGWCRRERGRRRRDVAMALAVRAQRRRGLGRPAVRRRRGNRSGRRRPGAPTAADCRTSAAPGARGPPAAARTWAGPAAARRWDAEVPRRSRAARTSLAPAASRPAGAPAPERPRRGGASLWARRPAPRRASPAAAHRRAGAAAAPGRRGARWDRGPGCRPRAHRHRRGALEIAEAAEQLVEREERRAAREAHQRHLEARRGPGRS